MIVSDDSDLRDFLGQGLLLAGFWTSAIASGIQAIEVFRLRRFDLILIDAKIGGLSAGEVVRRLRSQGPGVHDRQPLTRVPIVVVVEPPLSDAERERLASAGADVLLDPPLEIEEVAIRLMTLVVDWHEANPDEPWADASVLQARGPGERPTG